MFPERDQRSSVDAVLQLAAFDKRDWQRALQHVLSVDARTLGVDRASYWKLLCHEPRMIRCELGYVRSADAFEQGATLLAKDALPYMDELWRSRVIVVGDVTTDPRTQELLEYCRARKISSMLDVPVWVESRLVGVLCHEHVGPARTWSAAEIDFVLAIAQVVATTLEARSRTQAEEEARRACLLAHASLSMSRSLDERVVAQHAVDAALPLLADWAALDLFSEDGTVERLAIQHSDPKKQTLIAQYAADHPPRPDAPHATVQAHRLGQSVVVPEITDEAMRNNGFPDEHIERLRALGLHSVMLVLVQVPPSIDAVMLFVATERTYDYAALKFAEDYGERIGAALNNARLYRKVNEALHARDEFLTLAAHELRTPFTSLRIACERLMSESEGLPNPAVVTSAQRILRQSRRLTRLVNRMLDASLAERRVPLVQLQEVDLVPLVREVVDELRPASRHSTIELTVPPAVIGRWDADRLQEVASNLIENAVKYGSDQPIRVTLAVEGDTAVLSVADRGIGIDPKIIPRLFEPYERGVSSKGYGGLGLGLFISREIVAAHGGTIEVTSELGVGSEFRARLPGVISASRLE